MPTGDRVSRQNPPPCRLQDIPGRQIRKRAVSSRTTRSILSEASKRADRPTAGRLGRDSVTSGGTRDLSPAVPILIRNRPTDNNFNTARSHRPPFAAVRSVSSGLMRQRIARPTRNPSCFDEIRPVLSVRPKIAELAFRVFARSVHPELYVVHQQRTVQRNLYDAKIEITNCGHVITWRAAGVTLCEVATGVCQPLPSDRCLVSLPLKGSRTEKTQCQQGIVYRTHFHLDTVAPEMFWMVNQQLTGDSTRGLLHRFESSGRLAFGAISYVHIDTRAASMLIQAIHTFPDDYAILKIESLFSLPAAATKSGGPKGLA